jgi:UDP-2,3-diacylglucosamine hydrolase
VTTLFISDLHLDAARAESTQSFLELLRGEARSAEALYILGDLFESWVGDDDDAELARTAAAALRTLSDHGVPIHFLHGNRDFLLGADYAARAGLRLLPETQLIDLYGEPTLLLHGDTLCTDDHVYQAFRRQSRDPRWQAAMLAKPLVERRALARAARAESARHMAGLGSEIMDVSADAVRDAFRTHGVRRMIHGHTHRPAIHELDIDGRKHTRVVLADWYGAASVLRVDSSGISQAGI